MEGILSRRVQRVTIRANALKPLRLAFLGCGFITQVHSRHLKGFQTEIVCSYASRDRAKAEEYCRRYRGRGELCRLRRRDRRSPHRRRGHRGAAALSPRSRRFGRSRPASTCWSRSRRFRAWRTTRRRSRRATAPSASCWWARTITTSRSRSCCARCSPKGRIGEMVFAHFTTIARRLKTADDWRNDESDGGRRRVFRRRHSLAAHLPGSLGPRIMSIHGYRPSMSREGPDTAREEHDGGVPLRQRCRRLAVLLARDSVALPRPAAVEAVRPRAASSRSSRTALFVLVRGHWDSATDVSGLPRHPRLQGDVPRFLRRDHGTRARPR